MKKEKLPDTELRVMQAIWHMDTPASTSEIREELQKERPWNLSALHACGAQTYMQMKHSYKRNAF